MHSTDNKHNNVVNKGLKELSYIYYDALDYDTTDKTERAAVNMGGRPYDGKLFYNIAQVRTASQFDHGIHDDQCELCRYL